MPSIPSSYGLEKLTSGSGQAVVVLHGIRQTRDMLAPFARMIADAAANLNVYVYGYNHTRALEKNGRDLATCISHDIPEGRVDVVGYSMGGLVARLAATEELPSRIHTVVTIATPNRGSISNAELTTLGQIGLSWFNRIAPFAPRMEGVGDLTRAAEIMSNRRTALLNAYPGLDLRASHRRYASIPGLFYNTDRPTIAFGPTIQMSTLEVVKQLVGLSVRLIEMKRSHDGIVTERSNIISSSESDDWSEVHLVEPGPEGQPARCHAVIDSCREHDHISIINDAGVAQLTAALLTTNDWRTLRGDHPALKLRVRLSLPSSN